MKEAVPVQTGYLTQSVWPDRISDTQISIEAHAWYAWHPRYYGKRKQKYKTTYMERTEEVIKRWAKEVVDARINEFLIEGK